MVISIKKNHLLVWEVCYQILNSTLDGSENPPEPPIPSKLKRNKEQKQRRKERKKKQYIWKYGDRPEISDDYDDEDEEDFPIVPAAELTPAYIFEFNENDIKCDFREK